MKPAPRRTSAPICTVPSPEGITGAGVGARGTTRASTVGHRLLGPSPHPPAVTERAAGLDLAQAVPLAGVVVEVQGFMTGNAGVILFRCGRLSLRSGGAGVCHGGTGHDQNGCQDTKDASRHRMPPYAAGPGRGTS